jgi:transposase
VPVLANGKTATGRAWVYVRDDQPFGGRDPPAALFHFSRDRAGEHAERHLEGFGGILQADAFAGFNRPHQRASRARPRRPAALELVLTRF